MVSAHVEGVRKNQIKPFKNKEMAHGEIYSYRESNIKQGRK
jgi:hypothetical protein